MVDYQEIYDEAVSMFAAATGEIMTPELLFIDKFTDLKLISDVMKRNRIPQAGVDLKHFEELDAELLFGGTGNVLVIRTDTGSDRQQLIHAILHELARLYLRGREQIEFEPNDTFISVGHAIWSEVSAQLLARALDDDGVPAMLYETDLIKILGDASPQNLAGYAVEILALCDAVSWGVYALFVRKLCDGGHSALRITQWMLFYGTLLSVPAMFVSGYELKLGKMAEGLNLLNMLFLALVASVLCFFAWTRATEIIGEVRTSAWVYTQPAVTAAAGLIFIGENVTVATLLGIALVTAGLMLSEGFIRMPRFKRR